jgi:antitoxin MazE
MITAVQKWGNSLALRIPKAYAEETDIHDGSSVDLSLHDGNLVITPVRRKTFSLDELLDGITAENRHDVADTGSALGQEIW